MMIREMSLWKGVALIGLSAGLVALSPIVQAQNTGTIPVNARIQNVGLTHIGDLTWNRTNGIMTAVFRFGGNWGNVLDPRYDFRWFQIVKEFDGQGWGEGVRRWNYDPNNPRWVETNRPIVDPPRGGWEYQYDGNRNPTNRQQGDGADESPYYENDDDGNTYAFPNFSGQYSRNHRDTNDPNVHVERRFSTFFDAPGWDSAATISFQTFLVVALHGRNTFQQGQQNFLKLAGFRWQLQVDQQLNKTIVNVAALNLADKKQAIRDALTNGGFNNWNALQLDDFELVPEPASLIALTFGLAGLAYRRRRAA
jgi:hypothetical protein